MASIRQVQDLFNLAFPDQDLVGESKPNYWIIDGPGGKPRWVIPQDPKIGLPVLTKWHPFQLQSRVKWRILLELYRLGILGQIPNIRPVHINRIDWYGLTDVQPIFYVGTPSSIRKLVVSLVSIGTHQNVSVMKVPIGCKASQNIMHEATVLAQLAENKLNYSPKLIAAFPEVGQSLQEAVIGTIAGNALTKNHFQFLRDLKRNGQCITLSEYRVQLDIKMHRVELDEMERAFYQKIRMKLENETELPMFWCHGDFSPWNVLKSEGDIKVVDWERSQPDGLPLQDLFHFLSQQYFLQGHSNPVAFVGHEIVNRYLQTINLNISELLLKKLLLYYLTDNWLNACWEESDCNRQIAFQSLVNFVETLQ